MPTPEQILATLAATANDFRWLAIAWHVAAVIGIAAVVFGIRPANRMLAAMLTLPLLSVAVLAWLAGNPFNGSAFLLAAVSLAWLATRLPAGSIRLSRIEERLAGIALMLYGLVYPHFLRVTEWWEYLYAAPIGLVPCPTLSFVIGVIVACHGFGSLFWSRVLASFGLFYGFFGVLKLGVQLDWGLVLGSVVLLYQSSRLTRRMRRDQHA